MTDSRPPGPRAHTTPARSGRGAHGSTVTAYQVCARCGRRWPVAGRPGAWCPGCRGVLLSPDDVVHPVPPERRNYRWTALPPDGAHEPRERRAARSGSRTATPRYDVAPGWGLVQPPPAAPDDDTVTGWAGRAPDLLVATAAVFLASALAEFARYGLLLHNRTRLVDPVSVAVSDAAVVLFGVAAPLVAVVALVASALRLVEVRRRRFAAAGRVDPRSSATIVAGFVVPVVNLVMPVVHVRECVDDDPHVARALRRWWILWGAGAVMVALSLWRRTGDSMQARADAVLLAALSAVVAAATAVAALAVLRALDGHDLRGRERRPHRLLASRGPIHAPIATIGPVAGSSEPTAIRPDRADRDADGRGSDTEDGHRGESPRVSAVAVGAGAAPSGTEAS